MLISLTSFVKSQEKVFDLPKLLKENKLDGINRTISIEKDEKGNYIKVTEAKGEGIVWLPIEDFKSGTLTIEMRRKDVIQYIFHPKFTWKYLRENRTGEFEKGIQNAPQPNDWFVMTITIQNKKIEVFINYVIVRQKTKTATKVSFANILQL